MSKSIILIWITSMFILQFSIAQDNVNIKSSKLNNKNYTRRDWMNFGIGTSSNNYFNSIDGVNAGGSFNFMKNVFELQVGFNTTFKLSSDANSLNVINFSIGPALSEKYYLIAFVAGPAAMWG